MVTEEFVQRRKGRCMAQTLEEFEREVEPFISEDLAKRFKALLRRKLNVFASDLIEAIEDDDQGLRRNASAEALRDRLHPDRT